MFENILPSLATQNWTWFTWLGAILLGYGIFSILWDKKFAVLSIVVGLIVLAISGVKMW